MEREYKEIVTPVGGHKIKIKAWLTGRERRAIRSILLEGVNFSGSGDEEGEAPKADYSFEGGRLDAIQDKSFESVIVEIDGKTDDIVNQVVDMREEDYNFIVQEIDKVTGGLDEEAKKKLKTSTSN